MPGNREDDGTAEPVCSPLTFGRSWAGGEEESAGRRLRRTCSGAASEMGRVKKVAARGRARPVAYRRPQDVCTWRTRSLTAGGGQSVAVFGIEGGIVGGLGWYGSRASEACQREGEERRA